MNRDQAVEGARRAAPNCPQYVAMLADGTWRHGPITELKTVTYRCDLCHGPMPEPGVCRQCGLDAARDEHDAEALV